jgi:hypothetical protein
VKTVVGLCSFGKTSRCLFSVFGGPGPGYCFLERQ